MAELTEITLGDRKFGISRLTIGELLELDAIQMVGTSTRTSATKAVQLSAKITAMRVAGGGTDAALAELLGMVNAPETGPDEAGDAFMRRMGKRMIDTIAVALSSVAPEMTAAEIRKLKITPRELQVAYTDVLTHAGLIVTGEASGNP